MLQNQPIFPVVNEALALLATGNQSGFSGDSLTINDVVGIPYICSDYAINDNTWEGFQKSLEAAEKVCRSQLNFETKLTRFVYSLILTTSVKLPPGISACIVLVGLTL